MVVLLDGDMVVDFQNPFNGGAQRGAYGEESVGIRETGSEFWGNAAGYLR